MGLFSVIGGIIGGGKQKKAAKKASQLQYDAAIKGIDESARQFDATRADFQPYQEAGVGALDKISALLGLSGGEQQQAEINGLRESPLFKSLYRSGEEAVLSNASATGGLRGGNNVTGLAEFGEDTLSKLIQQQLSNYGGLASAGMGAAGNVGAFGADAVNQQAQLRNQGAGAKAQYQLIKGGIAAQNFNNIGGFLDDGLSAILGGGGGGGGGFSFKKLFG